MENNLKIFKAKLEEELKNIHPDDANDADKRWELIRAISLVKRTQKHFYNAMRIKRDLCLNRTKVIKFQNEHFVLEWVNHYEIKKIEITFLYPYYKEEQRLTYVPSAELEAFAWEEINKYESKHDKRNY